MNMKSVLHLLKLSAMAFISSFVAVNAEAQGTLYVSNLGNQWTEGGIGDIHPLFPGGAPYGNDTAHFTTGVGNFLLNTITLEFEFDITYPAGPSAPQWVSIQLFQGGSLLGTFGNPAIDPEPTQWPKSSIPSRAYTQFINFFSLQPITLNPFTQYSIIAGMPTNSPVSAGLLFTKSSAYTTASDWTMDATTAGDPFASGEFLVLGVQASAVPEPNSVVLDIAGSLILIWVRRSLSVHNLAMRRMSGKHTSAIRISRHAAHR